MNKSEWIAATAEASGITKKDAERVLNAAIDTITDALRKGDKVLLTGFGSFEVKPRQQRVGRNPQTRQAVNIPATKVPTFKPSQNLKEIVEK